MNTKRVVKDMFGRELNVGDYVLTPCSTPSMTFSRIVKFDFRKKNSIICSSCNPKTGDYRFSKYSDDVVFSAEWAAKNAVKVETR